MNTLSIGKYVDLKRLGRGGMADVYWGRDPYLDRYVAIKVIHPHLAEEENFEVRFRQEARLIAALRHPNIVQIYDFDFHENQPFMVMEYFQGGTLKDILAQHKARGELMPLGKIADLLEPIAQALDFAHTRGIVHRDIKPSNILFSSDGSPVIGDFGIAKILDESIQLTATGGVVGSPPYMSPEQAASKPVEKFSDIYSLGVVIYEMAAGRVPFIGQSITGVLMQHLNDPPPPVRDFNPNIPLPLQEVIAKALSKLPADRYPSAGHFSAAYKKALEGESPIQASLEAETLLEQRHTTVDAAPPSRERSASSPDMGQFDTLPDEAVTTPEPELPKLTWRRGGLLALGLIAIALLMTVTIAVISSGGVMPALTYLGLVNGSQDLRGEVLLHSSLDNEEAITSPETGLPGSFSLHPSDFVSAKEGNGVLFNRPGNCDDIDHQELSFPAWNGNDINIDLQNGEVAFWYQPQYSANESVDFYTLAAITLDGDTHSSIYLDFNEGYLSLNLVDNEWNWIGTTASYRAPLWQSGDWVYIRAVWDSSNQDDSLQIFVDDLRVDSGKVSGGWVMDAGEYAVRIFLGSSPPCGEYTANGIIDELVIRRYPQ
jgi:serine/threonine protein kinase